MSHRLAAGIAWSMWGLYVITALSTLVIAAVHTVPDFSDDLIGSIGFLIAFGAFSTVGAIVASRRPGNMDLG